MNTTLSQTITKPQTITLKAKLVNEKFENQYYNGNGNIHLRYNDYEPIQCFDNSHNKINSIQNSTQPNTLEDERQFVKVPQLKEISWDEIANHLSPESLWLVIFEQIYDFTDLLSQSDHFLSNEQKNAIIKNLKNPKYINDITYLISTSQLFKHQLTEINDELSRRKALVGILQTPQMKTSEKIFLLEAIASQTLITKKQVAKNKWFIIDGFVYDLKETFVLHPRGDYFYKKYAGKDCTDAFKDHQHPQSVYLTRCEFLLGKLADQQEELEISKISSTSYLSKQSQQYQQLVLPPNISTKGFFNGFQLFAVENQKKQQCTIF